MDLNKMKEVTVQVLTDAEDVYAVDAVLEAMFAAGIPFGKLNSLYRSVGVKEGLLADPAEVKENIANAIDEAEIEEFESYGDVEELAANIAADIDGAQDAAVIRAIKAYCKENDIEVPAKSRATGAGRAGGGKTAEAIINFFHSTPLESITKRGMYDAVLPVVKGPRNAYDNVNMHFMNNYAAKAGLDFNAAVEAVKAMTALDIKELQKEYDNADAPAETTEDEVM